MWTWLLVASLAPAVPTSGPAISPTVAARAANPAPFTLGIVDLRNVGRTGEEEALRQRLIAYARTRGLPVLGAESSGPDRTVEARFVLLGELLTGTSAVVTWQLVDRRDDTTVFEASTPVAGPRPVERGFDRLIRSPSFDRALTSAASRARSARGLVQLRRCLTPGTHGRGRVGHGAKAGAAVVVSPDGFAWAAAHSLPLPPAPIEVRTATGTWSAQWVAASADLDVALLALPTGPETPCAALADHIPRAREPALTWHPQSGRQRTRILGFRLHERPGTIVVEAPLAPGAFLFDAKGAVLGLRAPGSEEPRVRPHRALATSLGVTFGPTSEVPSPSGPAVRTPDPIFLPPVDRTAHEPLR